MTQSNGAWSAPAGRQPQGNALLRRALQIAVQFVVLAGITFLAAGTLRWPWAWLYLAAGGVVLLANFALLPPDLIQERATARENVKTWDRWLGAAMLVGTLALLVVAGLDKRFSWTAAYADAIHAAALAVWLLGQGLFTWAMTSNHYFSTRVRIQKERGQQVATGGPYRYVRHPGYVGAILYTTTIPIILGSLWGLIPALLVAVLFVVRTRWEDQTLQSELEGYGDYAQRTRYRLLPGIW